MRLTKCAERVYVCMSARVRHTFVSIFECVRALVKRAHGCVGTKCGNGSKRLVSPSHSAHLNRSVFEAHFSRICLLASVRLECGTPLLLLLLPL